MLAMTRKILQWLQDNEAQLQDIDYADEVDLSYDVKTPARSKLHRHEARLKAGEELVDSLVVPMSKLRLRQSTNPTTPTDYNQATPNRPQRPPERSTAAQWRSHEHPPAIVTPKRRHRPKCLYCSDRHVIRDCPYFVTLDRSQKLAVIRDRKLCFRCLNKGHVIKRCRSRVKCDVCGRRHLTVMHRYKDNTAT